MLSKDRKNVVDSLCREANNLSIGNQQLSAYEDRSPCVRKFRDYVLLLRNE